MKKNISNINNVKTLTTKELRKIDGGGGFLNGFGNPTNSPIDYGEDDDNYSDHEWKFLCYRRNALNDPGYRSYTDNTDFYTVCYPL
ncbi:ComC/BlpC family leader-containing pheromone/bacteriocin [Tenacibaculum sp. 190524A05c]|uniref:ComC/BlpC family leader-containing pheromone/bacteriocin n=1 Tax=Tenacibaculum platacis TaxID=3137852 RepID=UPI0032B1157F